MDLLNVSSRLAERLLDPERTSMRDVNLSDINDTSVGDQPVCGERSGNASNCTDDLYYDGELEHYQSPFDLLSVRIVFICLYSIVFLLCFVGNLIVIVVILKHRRMRTTTNFFLANLAVADFCVGVFCVLPNLSLYLCPYWMLGKVMCKLYYFVQAMSYTASVNILTIISIERYFAIIYPLRSKQLATMCLLRLAVILVWVVAGAAGTPYLIFYDTVDIPNTEPVMIFCLAKDINQKAYSTLNFLFGYIIPLALMTVMYSCISNVLWKTSMPRNFGKSSGYTKKCYSVAGRPSKKKDRAKVGTSAACGEQYEMNEKVAQDKNEEEQQKLVDKSSRRTNASRLLKRLDSSLSVDGETNENETESEIESDDRRPGASGGCKAVNSRSLISGTKSPMTGAKGGGMNGMNAKARCSSAAANHHSTSAGRPVLQVTIKKPFISTTCKQENALLARRRVIRLLIVVIVSFASCVLPYHIRVLWQTWEQPNPSFWNILISPITFVIYYLNSGLNPLFYAFLSDRFRECLLEVVTCRDYRVRRRMSFTNRTMHSIA